MHPINPDTLPPQIRWLVKRIGLAATCALLREYGGTPFDLPRTVDGSKKLNELLTHEQRAELIAARGGERLELPKFDSIARQIRDHDIMSNPDNLSNPQLAKRYNLTRRQIINIRNKRDDDNQFDLFSASG